jgi:hypothetical protein
VICHTRCHQGSFTCVGCIACRKGQPLLLLLLVVVVVALDGSAVMTALLLLLLLLAVPLSWGAVLVSVLGVDGGAGLTRTFLRKGTTLFLPLVLLLVLTVAGAPELLLLLRSVPEGLSASRSSTCC